MTNFHSVFAIGKTILKVVPLPSSETNEIRPLWLLIISFEIYKLITGPIQINNSEYTLQIVLENEMFGDFIDNSLPILIVSIILGLILSGIGAMYVSKKFIYKIKGVKNLDVG